MRAPAIALPAMLAMAALTQPHEALAAAFNPFQEAGIDRKPDAPIPFDLGLRDQDGAPVTLRQLSQARPLVLVPVLHNCPNICGVTLAGLAQAIAAQSLKPGQDFNVVAFGIDPKEGPADAQGDLARLRQAFPALPQQGIHAVTGDAPTVAAIAQALGYRYAWNAQLGQYAHIAALAVLSPEGRLSRWLYGVTFAPNDLKLALVDAGHGKLGDWTDQILLLCYHYDPVTGRYGSIVWGLLRGGGILTVLGVLGWVGLAVMRERRRRKADAS